MKTDHIQIRVTKEKKEVIKTTATQKGYENMTDYIMDLVNKDLRK